MDRQSKNNDFLKTYIRRPGTDNFGRDYETKVTALLALRCATVEDTEDMWLGSNVDDVGDFDDIVLYRRTSEGKCIIYMVQLKHQENPESIHRHEFRYDNDRSARRKKNNQHFSLPKYNTSFVNLKRKLDNPAKNESEIIQHLREVHDMVFVLFTNKNVDDCYFLKNINDDRLRFLDTSCVGHNIYKVVPSNQSDFLQRFFLFAKQVHVNDVNSLIEKTIKEVLGVLDNSTIDFTEVGKKFVEFIRSWANGSGNNNSKIYFTLTKCDIINKLSDILLSPYKYDFSKEAYTFYNPSSRSIWNEITNSKKITVVEGNDIVFQFLRQYVGTEIKHFLNTTTVNWAEKLNKETEKLFYEKYRELKAHIFKLIGKHEGISMFDVYTSLWFENKISLLLVIKDVQVYEEIVKVIKLSNYSLGVVIIKDKNIELKFKEEVSDKYFATLHDLDDTNINKILNQSIKLQNRPGAILGKLIDKSMYKLITCKDLIYILQGDFNVGNEYQAPIENFIERSLSKIFLKRTVLTEINNEVFVVMKKGEETLTNSSTCLNLESNKDNVVLAEEFAHFEEKQKSKGAEKIVHQICFHREGYVEWKKSSGSTKNIRKYVKLESFDQSVTESLQWIPLNDIFENENKERFLKDVHVISANAGMGKTTLTDYISLKTPTNLWVIKINLSQHSKYYKDLEKNSNKKASDHLNYFNSIILDKADNLELSKAVSQRLLDLKQVLVLLDGFDEILSSYEQEVTEIAKSLFEEGFSLWLTTRPHMKSQLEDTFDTIALTLKPFTKLDQEDFLTKYFNQHCVTTNLNPKKCTSIVKKFVRILLQAANNSFGKDGNFMGIPLQTRLLAEVFSNNCQISLKNNEVVLDEIFDLLELYEKFIQKKIDVFSEKIGDIAEEIHASIENMLKLLAVKYLFPTVHLWDLNIEKLLMEQHNITFLLRGGIVTEYSRSDAEIHINFIHRTFAEYLAAQWLSDNFNNTDKKITNVAKHLIQQVSQNSDLVFRMFNLMLSKNCPLHVALINKNIDEAEKILKSDPNSINKIDRGGRTVLHIIAIWFLAHYSLDKKILHIVEKFPNDKINITDFVFGLHALDYAALQPSYFLLNKICEKSPELSLNILFMHDARYGLFIECAKKKYKYLFKTLLRYFAFHALILNVIEKNTTIKSYCTLRNQDYRDVLYNYVTELGVVTMSELFQFKSRNIATPFSQYYFDLAMAAALGTEENINYLLSEGTEINNLNYGYTSLRCAVLHKRLAIVELLLDNGAEIDKLDMGERTALHWSLIDSCHDIALNLISRGADCDMEDNLGNCSLHYAAKTDCTSIISEILSKGVHINKRNKNGETPLYYAVDNAQTDSAQFLLDKGADVNLRNKFGKTLLHAAVIKEIFSGHYIYFNNRISIVRLLLDAGVDIDMQDNEGNTALDYAYNNDCRNCVDKSLIERFIEFHKEAAILLLKRGAKANITNKFGANAFQWASSKRNTETATLIRKMEAKN